MNNCSVCGVSNAKCYDDLEGIFDRNKDNPLCEKHHESLFNSLEKKCTLCGTKVRYCCC